MIQFLKIAAVTLCMWNDIKLYICDLRRLSVLLYEADEHLFHKMVNNKDHCIHQLLPLEKILPMKLRATNCICLLYTSDAADE